MAIFLLSVNCCAVRCRKVWIFCSGGAILRGLRRCSYTTIWAGLTSRASWKHIALCDSGTPASHRLGACAQSPLHYPYARLSRQRLLLWPIREHYPLLQPETLALWVPDISAVIKNKIDSHCCCQQHRCNAETHLTAQALRHALMRMHGGFSHEQKRRRYGCRGKVWSCSVWCWMNIAKTPVASPATSTRWNARNCCGRRICCWLI